MSSKITKPSHRNKKRHNPSFKDKDTKRNGNRKQHKDAALEIEKRGMKTFRREEEFVRMKQRERQSLCIHTLKANRKILEYSNYAIKRIAFSNEHHARRRHGQEAEDGEERVAGAAVFAAIARMNGQIEIWYTPSRQYEDWSFLKRIPAKENTTVEAMMWLPGYRLITTGLHADIVEWDLNTLQPMQNSGIYGSAIWGMVLHPTRDLLATVCQDGRVRVYDSNTLNYKFSFGISDTAENSNHAHGNHFRGNRLQAVSFNEDGSRIFVGGFTGVYGFDFNGPSDTRLRFRTDLNSGSCWSLCHLRDGTLVAGDHKGFVHFIDAKFGTVQSQFKNHNADILQIVSSPDHSQVYATGSDPFVALYARNANGKWSLVKGLRPTYHDLHGLSMFNNEAIVTGGVDGYIYIHKCDEFTDASKHRNKVMLGPGTPLGNPMMQIAPGNNTVLVQGGCNLLSTIHIPSLQQNSTETGLASTGQLVNFFESPKLLHQITRMSRGGWGITASSISHNGRYICYSCLDSLYLIRLPANGDHEEEPPLQKIDLYREYKMVPGYHVAFGMEDRLLVVISRQNVVQVLNLDTMKISLRMPLRDQSTTTAAVSIHDIKSRCCFSKEAVHAMDMNTENGLMSVAQGENVLVFDLAPVVSGDEGHKPIFSKPQWSFTIKSNTNTNDTGLEAIIYKVKFFSKDQFVVLMTGNVVLLADVDKQDHFFAGGMRTGIPRAKHHHHPLHTVIPLLKRDATRADAFTNLYLGNNMSLFSFDGQRIRHETKLMREFHNIWAVEALSKKSENVVELVMLAQNYEQYLLSLPDVVHRHRFAT